MGDARSKPKRFLCVREKRSPGPSAKSGRPLVIEQLDLRNRKLKLELVDFLRARSLFSFACRQGDRDSSRRLFCCPSGRDRRRPGLHSCDGCGQPRALSWYKFFPGRGLVPSPGEGWDSPNAHPCESQSCPGEASLVVSLARVREESQSNARSASPVGRH